MTSVFIQSPEYEKAFHKKNPNKNDELWFGRIQAIREVEYGRLVKIQWYYDFAQVSSMLKQ